MGTRLVCGQKNIKNDSKTIAKCICGDYLQPMKDSHFSSSLIHYCDGCMKVCNKKETILYCPKENKSPQHPDGYCLCNQCVRKNTDAMPNNALLALTKMGYNPSQSAEALNTTNCNVIQAIYLLNANVILADDKKENQLYRKQIATSLKSLKSDKKIQDLINKGATLDEAINKIKQSSHIQINKESKHLIMNDAVDGNSLEDLIDKLCGMGYALQKSIKAIHASHNDIDIAIKYLQNGFPSSLVGCDLFEAKDNANSGCNAAINNCLHLVNLKRLLSVSVDDIDTATLLNGFHHLLHYHDTDREFEYIYNALGKCNITECAMIRRNRNINGSNNNKLCVNQSIVDQIHCHYLHTYDMGYKLTTIEQNAINDIKIDEENEFVAINQRIVQRHKILSTKHQLNKSISPNLVKYNKFNQLNTSSNFQQYSFGEKYYYSTAAKTSDNHSVCDYYVAPKYKSFKEELISNTICTMDIEEWKLEKNTAKIKLETAYAKSMLCWRTNYLFNIGTKFNPDDSIHLCHLIAISVYCNYTYLSFKFTETYRSLHTNDVEPLDSMISRHSNFCYLGRYISEAIESFSAPACYGKIRCFYHGIQQQMVFDAMSCIMSQPLSTTSLFEVASAFSNKNGMIIDIKPDPLTEYFCCDWLSKFPNERELLFIGAGVPMTFQSITNSFTGKNYKMYITCLSIVGTMVKGWFYGNDDGCVYQRLITKTKDIYKQLDPKLVGAKPISNTDKFLTIKLIKNELNCYDELKYSKCLLIPPYINQLFHHICSTKQLIIINWQSMNVDISKLLNYKEECGYCGYLFLKYLFCKQDMINLEFVHLLYPNCQMIEITNLDVISTETINTIFKFLNDSKLPTIKISLNQSKNPSIIQKLITTNLKNNFENIGYDVTANNGILEFWILYLKMPW